MRVIDVGGGYYINPALIIYLKPINEPLWKTQIFLSGGGPAWIKTEYDTHTFAAMVESAKEEFPDSGV